MTEKGTTLVELVMVLAILSLVTTIAANGLLAAVPRSLRQSATAEFAVELRAAHRLAVVQRRPIRAAVDSGSGTLRLAPADDPGTVLRQYHFAERGVRSAQLSRGSAIVFYPSGRSASPVTIVLTMQRGETAKLTVSITGKVTWS